MNIAVIGHSFLGTNHSLRGETERYLADHPAISSYYVAGKSGLRYQGTADLLRDMKKAGFQPDSIYFLLGDNDICTRDGRPQEGIDLEAFPAVFHDRREAVIITVTL